MQENRDNKPWEGTLYLCHSSEIVCKLLYKKFFRKQDTTVIYGQWKQVLMQQQKIFDMSTSRSTLPDIKDDASAVGDVDEYVYSFFAHFLEYLLYFVWVLYVYFR